MYKVVNMMPNSVSMFRKTKIVCTIGPATDSPEGLRELVKAGMNVARLNMSHASHKDTTEIIKRIKTINKTAANPVAILLDTQGPEIRTGDMKESVMLNVGDVIDIQAGGGQSVEQKSTITVNYRDMFRDLKSGDRITVDNGLINLDVIEKTDFGVKCTVVDGGVMKSRRHINLPGIRINLPSITPKDEQDILFAIKNDLDFIALSFVRSAADVEECKRIIQRHNGHAQVIAKIEDRNGVDNMKEIIDAAAGIMIARGDLGVEVPVEELPLIQREIIAQCARAGKRVIVATHLLESMIENPMPTRAEVTDVANAVFEQTDAVMLSGETSVGKYPAKATGYLDSICRTIEPGEGMTWARHREVIDEKARLSRAAVELAESMQAAGIIVITRRGVMADHVTSFHPAHSTIFAFTNMSTVRRKLILNRGVYAYRIDFSSDPEKTIRAAFQVINKKKLLPKGTKVVVVSDVLAGDYRVDAIQVRPIE